MPHGESGNSAGSRNTNSIGGKRSRHLHSVNDLLVEETPGRLMRRRSRVHKLEKQGDNSLDVALTRMISAVFPLSARRRHLVRGRRIKGGVRSPRGQGMNGRMCRRCWRAIAMSSPVTETEIGYGAALRRPQTRATWYLEKGTRRQDVGTRPALPRLSQMRHLPHHRQEGCDSLHQLPDFSKVQCIPHIKRHDRDGGVCWPNTGEPRIR